MPSSQAGYIPRKINKAQVQERESDSDANGSQDGDSPVGKRKRINKVIRSSRVEELDSPAVKDSNKKRVKTISVDLKALQAEWDSVAIKIDDSVRAMSSVTISSDLNGVKAAMAIALFDSGANFDLMNPRIYEQMKVSGL